MNTKQLRQKILDLAIRGKLVPQDPNDEPASVLLERVRTEKERLIKEGKIKRDKKDSAVFRGDDKSHYEQLLDGWAWCRLGEICDNVLGKMLDIQKNKGEYKPYLRNINVRWGNFDLSDLLEMRFEDSEYERYRVITGDLIICEGGEPGRCAVWKNVNLDMRFQKALHRVRPLADISAEYLYFVIWRLAQRNELDGYFTGSTIKHLTGQSLVLLAIPLPPIAEQHRIVAAIESAFAVIDEIERNKTDLQSAVTAAKSKILSLAIRGKLVPQDLNDEPASVLLERIRAEREALIKAGKIKRGKNENSAVRSCDNSYYDGIPDSWGLCTLDDVGITNIGLTYKPTDICADGVPVLRSSNIKGCVLDYTDLVRVNTYFSDSLELNEGDILICARNGSRHLVGKCALIPKITERMTFGAFMAVYRSECSHFIYHFFNSPLFRRIFESEGISTQINQLTQAMIKETIIPLPPLAEQRRIAIAIEAAFEQLDNISAMLT